MSDPASKTEALAFTYEDYRHLPDDGKRYEIIEGELLMTPSPTTTHQRVSRNIEFKLHTFTQEHGLGELLHAPLDVILSDINVVQPDILFLSNEHLDRLTEENLQGAPDLIVEILSPASRDRDVTVKRKLYARFGVREYWIVDPEAQSIEVLALTEAGYEPVATFAQDDTLTSPLLPGLQIPLSEIFSTRPTQPGLKP